MGASNLIPKLTDPSLPDTERIDPNKWIREYTIQDWALVVKAFKAWPFAPDVSQSRLRTYVYANCYNNRSWFWEVLWRRIMTQGKWDLGCR